jgi:hypothetical protein
VEEDAHIKRTDAGKPHLKRKRKPEKSEDVKTEGTRVKTIKGLNNKVDHLKAVCFEQAEMKDLIS